MRFHSLPAQVAGHLKAEIGGGRWIDYLPGERSLATALNVSRRTITAALAQLQGAGIVQAEPGRGHRIILRLQNETSRQARQIGLLIPAALDAMRPGAAVWVNDLQALLIEAGFRLNVFFGSKYFSGRPGAALGKLIRANPQDCWILVGSSMPTQRWFARERIPSLVAGTCHGDVILPDVDLDWYAIGRHVAGRLTAHRHRRVALFLTEVPGYFRSEADTERGFREVIARAGSEVHTVYHERTPEGVLRVLRRLFTRQTYPTALVVISSTDYLTATSYLAQRRLRVPGDVSVIARNDDVFMNALLPEPTRYHWSPHVFARKMFRLLMQVAEGQALVRPHTRIMPDFITGGSLGTAPDSENAAKAPHYAAAEELAKGLRPATFDLRPRRRRTP